MVKNENHRVSYVIITFTMSNHFTKYCCHLFVGCDNVSCRYAHTPEELRGPAYHARSGVRFVRPHDSYPLTTELNPKLSFIVYLDEEHEQPSVSLSQLVQEQDAWYQKKFHQARWHRAWVAKKAYYASLPEGEQDMDISDDEMECGEQDMDISE